MTERFVSDSYPPDEVRLPMCEWLHRHGIDPHRVCAPGWIERRPEQRQIAYEAYAHNEQGQPYRIPGTDDVAREVHVVQLEAEPSPFPPIGDTQ